MAQPSSRYRLKTLRRKRPRLGALARVEQAEGGDCEFAIDLRAQDDQVSGFAYGCLHRDSLPTAQLLVSFF